jgi:Ca-activated chloride channel family protein
MRLATPEWLAVAALVLLCAAVWFVRRRWQRYPFPVITEGPRGRRRFRFVGFWPVVAGLLAALAFGPLAVALARPQEVLSRTVESAQGIDIAVVLDISGSMAALDFQPSDRLGVAKNVIKAFLDNRAEDRIALVVFAGAAVTLCPLTLDHEVQKTLLDDVKIGVLPDGTAIGMGLGTAVSRLRASAADSKLVVLVTDGSNNAGQLDPLTAADLAVDEDVTVHTVLVGRGGQVPMPVTVRDPWTGREERQIRSIEVETNPELLAEIARRTGGTSFRARDAEALREVFAAIDAMETTEFTSTRLVRYSERFTPWALAALGLLLAAVAVESIAGRTPW